ncbi:hypothetical protein J2Y69_002580 [Microbacterium resistens]|uniref:2-oxoglutarate dehydrogenase n=1 Tax=Microbacterium resistens TaxID=156977 RepID=A0ABU1SEC5_9MICO|nr:DUF6049 family protein [Microbacterium resistens]MDR6867972.1 hypothetical protein [Microbacterium resistens]
MTASHSPEDRARRAHAGPRPARRSRLRATAVVALTALAVLTGSLAPGLSASPAIAATSPTPTPTPEESGVALSLAPDAHGTYVPGTPLTASVSVQNGTEEEFTTGYVRLDIGRSALADRVAVTAWLDGSSSPALTAVGGAETPAIGDGSSGTASISVPALDVGALAPGVYPIRATFTPTVSGRSPDPVTAESVIVVSRGQRAAVSVIVPITATPAADILSPEELIALTAPDGALTAQLDAASGTSAILAVDPAIPAAIRALGTSAPPTATTWLNRLEALSNERFALQFADADTAAQAAAGLTAPLGVDTLAPFLRGQATATPTPTSSATPSPSSTTAPAVPSVEDLTAMGSAQHSLLWPRGEVSAQDVAALAGFRSPGDAAETATTTILPSTSFTTGADHAPVPARGDVDGSAVLAVDAAVSDALSRAAAERDPLRRGAPLAEAEAMLWFADPAGPVLAGLARDETRQGDALSSTLAAASGGIAASSLAGLLSSTPAPLSISSAFASDRASAVTDALEDERQVAAFSSILDEPAQLTVRQRISILRLFAVGLHRDASSFSIAFADQRAVTRATLGSVGIQPSNPILISAAVDVPIWLRNDLPYPVNVRLGIQPSDARLDVPVSVEAKGQAGSTTRLKVPVEARVATAEVNLSLSLTSPTGVPIGSPQVARLTVHAEWESIGLIVLGAIAALLIGGGIVRTILRRRSIAATHAADGMNEEKSTDD